MPPFVANSSLHFFSADSILGESFSSFAKGKIDVVLSLLQLINTN